MTKEDRDLLFKDLCARVPYGVKLNTLDGPQKLDLRWLAINNSNIANPYLPYLYPLSSMTEEQRKEYNSLCDHVPTYFYEFGDIVEDVELHDNFRSIDYLIANHFDYRGLIPLGLAKDATGLGIY